MKILNRGGAVQNAAAGTWKLNTDSRMAINARIADTKELSLIRTCSIYHKEAIN